MHRIHQESAFNAQGNHLKVNNLLKETKESGWDDLILSKLNNI